MICNHDIIEKDNACADGMCPICAAARAELAQIENERLTSERNDYEAEGRRHIKTIAQLRYDNERLIQRVAELEDPHYVKGLEEQLAVLRELRELEHKP